ncbi:MAG TPA: lysylphosphatidylglycerol synthase transmembrane domain-containing protein [Terriglobia bacterium]|nr:lysylphosphatidylglycerol synthase transmembrane domain-containing protein [Terriglobia bacterium]
MTKRQQRWFGTGAVALALAFVAYHFTRHGGWQHFNWNQFSRLLLHANPWWLAVAVVASYASYAVRAYRWKFFLDPIRKASLWNLFVAQILGFSSIYLVGRIGEIVRPAYIARKEKVSYTSQAAIWLLERVYDGLAVCILFGLALDLEPIRPKSFHAVVTLRRMHEGAFIVLAVMVAVIAALAIFRVYSEKLIGTGSRVLRFLPEGARRLLGRLSRSFADGLDVIEDWRDLSASVGCTVLLWLINVSIFWLVFHSLGGSVARLTWWAAALALFFAALGLLLQLPGIGGGYELGIILALRQVFHVPAESATGAGVMAWLVVLVPCLTLGIILLAYEGLSFKRLGKMAEEETVASSQLSVASPESSRQRDSVR